MGKQAILNSLLNLGIAPGETLFLCGKQPADPKLWLDGIWELLGPDGTILTHHPLLEVIRQHPGSQSQGIYSAIGARASSLIHSHRDAYGFDSPIGRLYRLGGRILLIGGDPRDNTGLYLAASLAMADPCPAGFQNLAEDFQSLAGFSEGYALGERCQAMPMANLVNLASKLYCQSPGKLCCGDSQCQICYRSRKSAGSSVR
jgi:hypothetical protein